MDLINHEVKKLNVTVRLCGVGTQDQSLWGV